MISQPSGKLAITCDIRFSSLRVIRIALRSRFLEFIKYALLPFRFSGCKRLGARVSAALYKPENGGPPAAHSSKSLTNARAPDKA